MTRYRHRHLLGIEPLSREDVVAILDAATGLREVLDRPIKKVPALRGKTVVNLFYEASTRTRASFEVAEKVLSADSLTITTAASSVTKGESLLDTVAQPGGHEPGHDRDPARGRGRAPLPGAPLPVRHRQRRATARTSTRRRRLLDALTLRQKKGRARGTAGGDRGRPACTAASRARTSGC